MMPPTTDKKTASEDVWSRLPRPLSFAPAIATGVALTSLATVLGQVLSGVLPSQGTSLLYLLTIVLGAIAFGVLTGISAAVLSFLAYNFFFIDPVFTFSISDTREFFALVVFFAVAITSGSLAGRMREVADRSRCRAQSLQNLNEFSAQISRSTDEQKTLDAVAMFASKIMMQDAIVLLRAGDDLTISAMHPTDQVLETADWQAARRCVRSASAVYPSEPSWPGARYEFHPLQDSRGVIGVVGLAGSAGDGGRPAPADALGALLRHTAIALDRIRLEAENENTRKDVEREHLRSTLLSSLSHDLKTPLASILGSVTSLRQLGAVLDEATRDDLLQAIEEETTRLSQFVTNILDITRLESQMPNLRADWIDVGEAVRFAVSRVRGRQASGRIHLEYPPQLPLLRGDAILFEHVIFNLLDNALKYSPPPTPVYVWVNLDAVGIVITVADEGPGLSKDDLELIFNKFYRGRTIDLRVPGTGLGLTICRRIIEGMGGTIIAQSPGPSNRGSAFIVRLPVESDHDSALQATSSMRS